MDEATLNQDGTILPAGRPVQTEVLACLGKRAVLEPGFSLRSFFKMIGKYEQLAALSEFFPGFLERVGRAPESGCRVEGLDCLELGKTVEMIGFPGKPRLEIYTTFYGLQDQAVVEIKPMQIEDLLDLPIRLGRIKHIVFGDKVDIFEFETVFNLFEFIDSIAWELSFHGTPVQCAIRSG